MRKTICVIGSDQGLGGAPTAFQQLACLLVQEEHPVSVVSIVDGNRVSFVGKMFALAVPLSGGGK